MQLYVTPQDKDKRLDIFISENCEFTRSLIQKMNDEEKITVNSKKKGNNYKVRENDFVEIEIAAPVEVNIEPQDIKLNIVYEDSDVIIINKSKGMVVHPSQENYRDTLVNALLFHCKDSLSGINGELRPGIVHRLDKDTSGLMIAAKSDAAHKLLAEDIKAHDVKRIYHAILAGSMKDDRGTLDFPLGRSKKDFKKIAVYKNADENEKIKNSITHYEVIAHYYKNNKSYTYTQFRLETGRTHQIRVHAAHIGHPVLGDTVYGNENYNKDFTFLGGQCLHSKYISFMHPIKNIQMEFESELPEYFKKALTILE